MSEPMRLRVAVIGGGLAGIAAALQLADAGYVPVVLETRPRLGGRATSFVDPRTNQILDNCQHVLLGCCTNLLDLYDRLGVLDRVEWHRTLYWTRGGGVIDTMRGGRMPAPLHLTGSFRRLKLLSAADRRDVARAMWKMIRMGASGRLAWRNKTFADFLESCKQSSSAVRAFWETVIVSACNLSVDRVGAVYALQVFQEGFLANAWSYTMGLSSVPLVELYDPAAEAIAAAGGELRLGTSVRALTYDGSRMTGAVTATDAVPASAVISTVPPDRLSKLVTDAARTADPRLRRLDEIAFSPIVGVHLTFETEVMDLPHLVLVERDVDWLFDKGVDDAGRQHLHAVKSAADDWLDLSEAEIVARTVADLHHVCPRSRGLEPVAFRAVKEKRATFAATPEFEDLRPSSGPGAVGLGGGGIPNLYLGGDWCDTGWPSTMEGAVRSGYAAAAALSGQGGLVEDVAPGRLARWLGL